MTHLAMDKEGETKIWREVFKKQIKLKMDRYMERTHVETSRPKNTTWGHDGDRSGNGDSDGTSNAEYITRLTSLRDSLIDQEEINLAQALERLRLHSISNKTHSNRLRTNSSNMNGDFISAQPLITQRRNMISTVERFRQIRPKRHQPMVFPLQGRQMLDVPRPASEEPISNFGNSTNRSDNNRSFNLGISSRVSHSKVEETVQTNLQRLIQRTSSIPNIGRKALRQQEELEPKAKPLLNIRAKLQKQPGSHLASPFLLSTHEPPHESDGSCTHDRDRDIPNLSPQAHKLGPVLQGDMIDMDVLQQYYQTYIDSASSPGQSNNNNNSNGTNNAGAIKEHNRHPMHSFHLQKLHPRHHPFKYSGGNKYTGYSPVNSQYNNNNNGSSIVSGSGKVIALSDLPDIMLPRTTYTYISTAHPASSVSEDVNVNDFDRIGRFPELQTSYRYHLGHSDNNSSTASGGGSKSWVRSVERRRLNNSPVDEHPGSEKGVAVAMENGKRKIVVDMPNIIFNAASPDFCDDSGDQVQGHRVQPETVLRKARKQQEIRKKELNNLLEDVKELNLMTEVLHNSSVANGGFNE